MVKHTTSVKKSNKSGAKGPTRLKKNYKFPYHLYNKSPYQLYKDNGGYENPKLTLDECEQNYDNREDDDPDCEYYSNNPLYEWHGADACGEGKWRKIIHSSKAVFDACTVYGPTKGPAFAVKILNKYINKACYKMHNPMKWAKKNEKFLRELGTIAKLQESPCCVHTPFASEIPNCCGVHYNGEHISLCNALLGAIKRNDACREAVWKWLFRHYVKEGGLSTHGDNIGISFDMNEKNVSYYKLAMKFGWVLHGPTTWFLEDIDDDSGDDDSFQIETDVDAQSLYNHMECVRDKKFRTEFREEMAFFYSFFPESDEEEMN